MTDTWRCSSCDTINAAARATCMVCDGARSRSTRPEAAAAKPATPRLTTTTPVKRRRTAASGASPPGTELWMCANCETRNAADADLCMACRSTRESSAAPKPAASTPSARRPPRPSETTSTPRPGRTPPPPRPPVVPDTSPDYDWLRTVSPALFDTGLGTGAVRRTGSGAYRRSTYEPGITPPATPSAAAESRPRVAPPAGPRGTPSPPASRPPYVPPTTRPAPAAAPKPRKRRGYRSIGWLLTLGIACGIYLTRHSWLDAYHRYEQSHQTAPTPTTTFGGAAVTPAVSPAPPSCPDEAAIRLPAGERESSQLVETRETNQFRVTICKGTSGALYYYGVALDNASLWIDLPATRSGDGYVAVNGDTEYDVQSRTLIVRRNGSDIVDQVFVS